MAYTELGIALFGFLISLVLHIKQHFVNRKSKKMSAAEHLQIAKQLLDNATESLSKEVEKK